MFLREAAELFLLAKEVAGLSPGTLSDYRLHLERFNEYLDSPQLDDITTTDVRRFLYSLQENPPETNAPIPRPKETLSPSTIRNICATISSFYSWAVKEGIASEHVAANVERPKPDDSEILPFSKSDIVKMLKAVKGKRAELRDTAIILFLLDTGVRNNELCQLTLGNVDISAGRAFVKGKSKNNRGKGKNREVHFSARTRYAIKRYLLTRDNLNDESYLFVTIMRQRQMQRNGLSQHIKRIGERVNVKAWPHRFRHTFAIQFLRNNGNVYALQRLLGHTSLDMTRRYLAIAEADVENAHKQSSPVDNWKI